MTKTINENSFQKKKKDPRLLLLEQLVVIYITRFLEHYKSAATLFKLDSLFYIIYY